MRWTSSGFWRPIQPVPVQQKSSAHKHRGRNIHYAHGLQCPPLHPILTKALGLVTGTSPTGLQGLKKGTKIDERNRAMYSAGGDCRRDWCTSQNKWHHDGGKWCEYIEATSQDISQEAKAVANGSSKCTMTPSILPKLWQNGLRSTKSRYWSGHHNALTSIPYKIFGQNRKGMCEQGGLQTWLSYSVRRNGPKFTQLIVGSLWKAT